MNQEVDDTMNSTRAISMQNLIIMLNLSPSEQCPLCDVRMGLSSVGPELFTADHKGPVCRACATKRDPGPIAVLGGAQAEYARYWADRHSLPSLYQLAIVADEWCHEGIVYAKAELWLQRRYKPAHDYNFPVLLHGDHADEGAREHVLMDFFTEDEATAVEAALRDHSVVGMTLVKHPVRFPLFTEHASLAAQVAHEFSHGVSDFDFLETINAHCCFYKGGKPIAREYYATCTPEGELDTRWLGKRILTPDETKQLFNHWSCARDTGTEQTLAVRRPPEDTEDGWDDIPF